MTFTISKHWIEHPKRYPGYPTNGRMLTRIMVVLAGDTHKRRVYDVHTGGGVFAPVIMIKDEQHRLTREQAKQIKYDFKTCRSRV